MSDGGNVDEHETITLWKNTSIPMWQVGIQGGKAYILTIQISFSAFQLLKVPQQCN
jgi:hypothetical protein